MAAGDSARREADRARAKAQRLARRADAFDAGADGEAQTAAALAVLGPGWVVLHDVRWPGRRLANIDHVVVGPGGIFIIDTKNWSGDVGLDGDVLRQNGRSREKSVAGAADAALSVAELAPMYASLVRPVICFARDEHVSGWARDVMICSTGNVVQMLRTRPAVLVPQRVKEVATRLDAQLQHARAGVSQPSARSQGHADTSLAAAGLGTGQQAQARSRGDDSGRARTRRRRGGAGAVVPRLLIAGALILSAFTVLPAYGDDFGRWFVGLVAPAETCESAVARRDVDGGKRSDRGPANERDTSGDRVRARDKSQSTSERRSSEPVCKPGR